MRRNADSSDAHFFRMGDRISVINGEWFVTTREGEEGPYASREGAEGKLLQLMQEWGMALSYEQQQRENELERQDLQHYQGPKQQTVQPQEERVKADPRNVWEDRDINMR